MRKYAIAALAVVAIGAAIAQAQVFTMPPPAGVTVLGCVFNTSPVTLTDGQTGFAQCDNKGNLSPGGGGGGGSVTQGTTPWVDSLSDGTTGPVAVKPASTPPLASDKALVVSLSPNSAGLQTPGQAAMSASAPVAIASDQAHFPIELQDGAGNNIGSGSNASSGLATITTGNLNARTWLYGFNGTTWDQLQVDGSKNLKVVIASNSTVVVDPCAANAKLDGTISQTTSTQVIAGTSAKKTYICSITLNGADAENISIVEGTGSVCATNIFALLGGTTANAGMNFAANSGLGYGNGASHVLGPGTDANAAAANVCVLQSGSGRVAGAFTYVQQ